MKSRREVENRGIVRKIHADFGEPSLPIVASRGERQLRQQVERVPKSNVFNSFREGWSGSVKCQRRNTSDVFTGESAAAENPVDNRAPFLGFRDRAGITVMP